MDINQVESFTPQSCELRSSFFRQSMQDCKLIRFFLWIFMSAFFSLTFNKKHCSRNQSKKKTTKKKRKWYPQQQKELCISQVDHPITVTNFLGQKCRAGDNDALAPWPKRKERRDMAGPRDVVMIQNPFLDPSDGWIFTFHIAIGTPVFDVAIFSPSKCRKIYV